MFVLEVIRIEKNIKMVKEGTEMLQGWNDKRKLGRPRTEVTEVLTQWMLHKYPLAR